MFNPSICKEVLSLQQLGVPESSINHGKTTMESGKFIVCCEKRQVGMIDLTAAPQLTRLPIAVDAAIMHPEQSILALRSKTALQIVKVGSDRRLKSCNMRESVVFCKWTSASVLGIVTDTAVYHWALHGTEAPVKSSIVKKDVAIPKSKLSTTVCHKMEMIAC